ncbi:MAG: hypothetical protein ACKVS9_09035 [Phycisphaerae bacterium]
MSFSPNARAARALAAIVLAALLSACVPMAQADILHLRDGDRHYGMLEQETETEILFRVRLKAGGATMLRRFARSEVIRVERSAVDAPPEDVARVELSPAADGRKLEMRDAEQILREALELLDDQDHAAALRALQRLVGGSDHKSLESLSEISRAARGIALDQLLAQTRLNVALRGSHGRLFHLQYVSPFEALAMAALLEKLQTENVDALFAGRSVASWAAEPSAYTGLRQDAPEMVRKTRLAAAAVAARLRFDSHVRTDASLRGKLIVLRDQLTALAAHVRAMTGFTQLGAIDDESDPTLIEARRLAASQPTTAHATQPSSQPITPTSRPSEEQP